MEVTSYGNQLVLYLKCFFFNHFIISSNSSSLITVTPKLFALSSYFLRLHRQEHMLFSLIHLTMFYHRNFLLFFLPHFRLYLESLPVRTNVIPSKRLSIIESSLSSIQFTPAFSGLSIKAIDCLA